jgi:hypothetical protein
MRRPENKQPRPNAAKLTARANAVSATMMGWTLFCAALAGVAAWQAGGGVAIAVGLLWLWVLAKIPGEVDKATLEQARKQRRRRRVDRAHAELERAKRPPGRREPIPRDVRQTVWERDGGRCVQCGETFELQFDHVIPVALGGATTVENLQLLCARCNRAKGASL